MEASKIKSRDAEFTGKLLEAGIRPARSILDFCGRGRWVFHVDDSDDRYVEVASSARSGDYLLVCRDGENAVSYVFQTLGVLVAGVARQLDILEARKKS